MPIFNASAYVQPDSVAAAFAELTAGNGTARLVGGGTNVILHSPRSASRLIDLSGLPLREVSEDADTVRIGAMATLTELLEHPLLASYAGGVMAGMLVQVGSPLLRNVATIGGHLARGRLSDVVPVLLVLDAAIEFHDGEDRATTLAEFFAAGEHRRPMIITAVTLPAVASGISAFEKFERTAFDIAMLNVAAYVELSDGHVRVARIAVGETPALARLVPEAAAALGGMLLEPGVVDGAARIAAATVPTADDARAAADYRTHLIGVGVRRCLTRIAERIGTG